MSCTCVYPEPGNTNIWNPGPSCSSECGSRSGSPCVTNAGCTGQNNTCFQEGTNIETAEGLKSIESIGIGDIVKSYDIENDKVIESKVYETLEHKDIDNGLLLNGIIKTTTNHPFYSDGQWVEASDLKPGDKILHIDGEEHLVESVEPLTYSTTVYNIEVEDTHNYFAEGYLVHNKITGGGGGGGMPVAPKGWNQGPGSGGTVHGGAPRICPKGYVMNQQTGNCVVSVRNPISNRNRNNPGGNLTSPCPSGCSSDSDCPWHLCCMSYGPDCKFCGYCGGGGRRGSTKTTGGSANTHPKDWRRGGRMRRSRRFQNGGHMHNVTGVSIPEAQTSHTHGHSHQIERPMADSGNFWGTPNAAYHMLRHRHDTYQPGWDGNEYVGTGTPIWEPYGNPDYLGPGQGSYPTEGNQTYAHGIPGGVNLSQWNVQTTGEVGSVQGAGHLHRTNPNIRRRRGGKIRNHRRRGGRIKRR